RWRRPEHVAPMRKCRQKDLTGCNQSVVGTAPNSSLNIYTQDADAHEFQTNAERILMGNSEFTPALDSPISVAFKSNDFILCQMYREGALTLDAVRQLRHDDRKLTYTRQQADKSIVCRKEVITKEQFIDLIQDATVQILF
ncbi:hypothetical protein ACTQ5A_11685, partial [Bacillota bacterium LCP21S3_F9]